MNIIKNTNNRMVLSVWSTGRFKFSADYDKSSCQNGKGPVPKDADGENQLSDPAFEWTATATHDEAGGGDVGPNSDTATETAPLLCKPSRTSL